jgi:ribosome-associated protein
LKILADHKALEPVLLEVKEHCSFADYFIICSGSSKRQVSALAEQLKEELSQAGVKPLGTEGMQDGLWVLMDYNTVVIHIFFHELRGFYDLEGLWADSPKTYAAPLYPAAMSPIPVAQESAPNPESESGTGHD